MKVNWNLVVDVVVALVGVFVLMNGIAGGIKEM